MLSPPGAVGSLAFETCLGLQKKRAGHSKDSGMASSHFCFCPTYKTGKSNLHTQDGTDGRRNRCAPKISRVCLHGSGWENENCKSLTKMGRGIAWTFVVEKLSQHERKNKQTPNVNLGRGKTTLWPCCSCISLKSGQERTTSPLPMSKKKEGSGRIILPS